jgi:uncharacterized protein YcnI
MAATSTTTARRLRRSAIAALAAAAAVLVLPAIASAHVEVKPGEVEGGDFAEVAFSVPNERDDASTVKLRVLLPTDQPLASVQTTPVPGWTITTKERKLATPIDFFGSKVSKVVSQITWKATDGGIAPGQFQDFPVSLGVLPTSGELTFKAVQTYSNGEVVKWDEVAVGGAEPEHPAPVLSVTAAADETGGETTAPPTEEPTTTATSSTGEPSSQASGDSGEGDDEGASDWVAIVLSVVALAASLGALGLTWKRRRT